MSTRNPTIQDLFAGLDADTAISAPDRDDLSYAGLRQLAAEVHATLAAAGIGRSDRIAIVLPNGPEMASAFVTLATAAATAPLNPGYKADEFAFYLDDLDARAVVVEQGSSSAVVEVARERGIDVLELEATPTDPAGYFGIQAATTGATAAGTAPAMTRSKVSN